MMKPLIYFIFATSFYQTFALSISYYPPEYNDGDWGLEIHRPKEDSIPHQPAKESDEEPVEDNIRTSKDMKEAIDNIFSSNQQIVTHPRRLVSGGQRRRITCEDRCLTTNEYNPVCGTDGTTYNNFSRFSCAQRCGKRVQVAYFGACSKRN